MNITRFTRCYICHCKKVDAVYFLKVTKTVTVSVPFCSPKCMEVFIKKKEAENVHDKKT